jgi:protein-S-isoprenylcysteine O-methyltransferase Ste14
MSPFVEYRWYLRRRTIFVAALLFGVAIGSLLAVLVAARAPSNDSFTRFIGYSLALAIPTAVLVSGGSLGVGLFLRAILPSDSRLQKVVTSLVSGIAIVLIAAGFSWLIAPTIELADFAWIPIGGSLIGGIVFTLWSTARGFR